MSGQPRIIEFQGEWDSASFPATRNYCGKFSILTSQSVVDSEQRDIYRHLVDQNSQGRWVYIPDGVGEEEANSFEVSPVTAREASMKPKSGQSESQKTRYVTGLLWDELKQQGLAETDQEAFYAAEQAEYRKSLNRRIEDLRRQAHYGGQIG